MAKYNYIPIKDFCELHGANYRSLISMRCRGNFYPKSAFKIVGKNALYIDEKFFLRRKAFHDKLRRYNEKIYFEVEDFFKVSELARSVVRKYPKIDLVEGGVYNYLYRDMFNTVPKSITKYRIHQNEWLVFKYFRQLDKGWS